MEKLFSKLSNMMMYLFIEEQIHWKTLSEVELVENKSDSYLGTARTEVFEKQTTMVLAMTYRLAKPKSFSHSQKSSR